MAQDLKSWFNVKGSRLTIGPAYICGEGGWDVAFGAAVGALRGREINLLISGCGGGDYDLARRCAHFLSSGQTKPVRVTVEGVCASAATVFLAAGSRVLMRENALLKFHRPSQSAAWQNEVHADVLRSRSKELDALVRNLAVLFAAHTGGDVALMRSLIESDAWLTAEEARRLKFVHEILPAGVAPPAWAVRQHEAWRGGVG